MTLRAADLCVESFSVSPALSTMTPTATSLVVPMDHHSINVYTDEIARRKRRQDPFRSAAMRRLAGALVALAILVYLLVMASYVLFVQLHVEPTAPPSLPWFIVTAVGSLAALALWRFVRLLHADDSDARLDRLTAIVYTMGDVCLCALAFVALCFCVRRQVKNSLALVSG